MVRQEQGHIAACPDAPHADDFERRVRKNEAIEQPANVRRQRRPIGCENLPRIEGFVTIERHAHERRRLVDETRLIRRGETSGSSRSTVRVLADPHFWRATSWGRTSDAASARFSRLICWYQTSSGESSAKCRTALRYVDTAATTVSVVRLRPSAPPRATNSTLAASRRTSHSHGPGSVSSKSFTSKTTLRSGDP